MNALYPEQNPTIEDLVQGHMNLVRKIAFHLHGRVQGAVEAEDLIQIGCMGLIDAAQKYTRQEGVAFAAYAAIRIRGAIFDFLRKNSNLCRTTIRMQQKVRAATDALSRKLQRAPEPAELANELGILLTELQEWQTAFSANVHQSIDEVYDDFSIWFTSDTRTPEQELNNTQIRALLASAVKSLPEREALVLQLYYVEELNIYEIGAVLEVTPGRVSQLKTSAVKRLRTLLSDVDGAEILS